MELGSKDKKLLNLLWKNARLSISDLGKMAGMSRELVSYRLANLEKKGIIYGYRTIPDYNKLKLSSYRIHIRMRYLEKSKEKEFLDFLSKHKEVLDYGLCAGAFQFYIFVVTDNPSNLVSFTESVKRLFGDRIEKINVHTTIEEHYCLRDNNLAKNKNKSDKEAKIKESDIKLVNLLMNDARISLKDLSKKLGKSYITLVHAIKRLEETGIIKAYIPRVNFNKIGFNDYFVFFSTTGLTEAENEAFRKSLILNPSTFWVIRFLGRYDYGAELIVKDANEREEKISEILLEFKGKIREVKFANWLYAKEE